MQGTVLIFLGISALKCNTTTFSVLNSQQNDFYNESTPCKTCLALQSVLEVNQRRVQFSGLGVSQDRNDKAVISSTICHVIEGVDQKDGCC